MCDQDRNDAISRMRQTIRSAENDCYVEGSRPALVEFVSKRDVRLALPYLALRMVEYDPNQDNPLKITFSTHIISVGGRGLLTIHQLLLAQMLMSVIERSERYDSAERASVWVDSIRIERKKTRGGGPAAVRAPSDRKPHVPR